MDNSIKSKVRAFRSQFKLSDVTLESLKSVIQQQGYTIIEFNNIANGENVSALLSALGLQPLAERSKGFTYADSKYRLVFLHEALSDREKLMVLSHEEGHIYCGHLASSPVLGRDVVEEHEANEFSHYLLRRSAWQTLGYMLKARRKASLAIIAAVALILVGCFAVYKAHCENTYFGEYYITSTGNKYHDKACGYVKGKDSVSRLTVEQYESGEYEPCGKCLA